MEAGRARANGKLGFVIGPSWEPVCSTHKLGAGGHLKIVCSIVLIPSLIWTNSAQMMPPVISCSLQWRSVQGAKNQTWQSWLIEVAVAVGTQLLLDAPEEAVVIVLPEVEALLFPGPFVAEISALVFRRKVRFEVRPLGLSEALHGREEVVGVVLLEVEALGVAEKRSGLGRAVLGLLFGHLLHFLFEKSGRLRVGLLRLGLVLCRSFFRSLLENLLLSFGLLGQKLREDTSFGPRAWRRILEGRQNEAS